MERALWVTRKDGEIIGTVDDLGGRNPASERFRAATMDGVVCFFPDLEEAEQFVVAYWDLSHERTG